MAPKVPTAFRAVNDVLTVAHATFTLPPSFEWAFGSVARPLAELSKVELACCGWDRIALRWSSLLVERAVVAISQGASRPSNSFDFIQWLSH